MTKKPKILAVDDEPENLKLLHSILDSNRYEVTFARSGQEAIQRFEQETFDLVLLDIMMPQVDGFKVLKRLQMWDRAWRTRVVMLSALDGMEDKLRAFSLGAVDFISKPFHREELLARIEARLSQPTMLETVMVAIGLLEPNLSMIDEAVKAVDRQPDVASARLSQVDRHLRQLLLYFRLKKVAVRLNAIPVRQIIENLPAKTRLEQPIRVDLPGDCDQRIVGDPDLIARLFAILLDQATRRSPLKAEVQVRVSRQEQRVAFSVGDEGPCIPEDKLQGLFDPLVMAREGSALPQGLAYANAALIAEKLGGRMSCRSNDRQTWITAFLPIHS